MLKKMYLQGIIKYKQNSMDIYNRTLEDLFDERKDWQVIKGLDEDQLGKLYFQLIENINLEQSPIDIQKLASAIQRSQSGVGGASITEFECTLCNSKSKWGNTNTPNICSTCAEKMAVNIAKTDIYEEESNLNPDFIRP